MARRVVIASVVVVVVVAGVAYGVNRLRSPSEGGKRAYKVSLTALPSTSTNGWVPGEQACPSGGRGDGPPRADASASPLTTSVASNEIGNGQLLAYDFVLEASPTAPSRRVSAPARTR